MSDCSTECSDDGSLPQVVSRYHEADFEDALRSHVNYQRAAEELTDLYEYPILPVLESKVSKALKELLFKDTMTAITCCDGCVDG